MLRREATVCFLLGASLTPAGMGAGEMPRDRLPQTPGLSGSRPNVVVIMVDDLDRLTLNTAFDIGAMPNVTRYIRNRGTVFTASYVTAPVCGPSRATFLTGQYAHNHRMFSNSHVNGSVLAFDDRSTVATWLQAAGYRTGHVGKYLNGYGGFYTGVKEEDLRRERARWDNAVGMANRLKFEADYVPPGWDWWHGLIDMSTYCVFNYAINENGVVTRYLKNGEIYRGNERAPREENYGTPDNYQTDVLARRAVDFLRETAGAPAEPFFLNIAVLAPHFETCAWSNETSQGTPWEDEGPVLDLREGYKSLFRLRIRPAARHLPLVPALETLVSRHLPSIPSFDEPDMTDKPAELQGKLERLNNADKENLYRQFAGRLASLLAVDNLVGSVGRMLEATGRLDNTVLIFTSDNGWFNGEHRMSSKDLAYEEGIHVPLFIRVPSGVPQASPRLALNNDLAVTIADLAGATPAIATDGRSLLPLIANPYAAPWRRQFLIEHFQSVWPDSLYYPVNHSSLLSIRTTWTSSFPSGAYTDYRPGVQYNSGYYLNPPATDELGFPLTPPDLEFAWQSPVQDAELYDMTSDPSQQINLLSEPSLGRPWAPERTLVLREVMLGLAACEGETCRAGEDAKF